MSYKWGINGNDLDWSMMEFLDSINEDLELALFRNEIELDEDGYIPEEVYSNYMDGNPTIIYYKSKEEIDVQKILSEGKKIDEFLDWYIIHDTNGNFVSLVGDVPDEYLTEEYIAERNEAEGEEDKS